MTILINNEIHSTASNAFLSAVLATVQLNEKKGIAVAVNNEIVPRTRWTEFSLKENDSIVIIEASQGG